jgi:hypothetical protein
LNVITKEPLVRTGPTARNLIISSSGSNEKRENEFSMKEFHSFLSTSTIPD